MKIYILSKGRAGKISTIKNFSDELLKKTTLVVQEKEFDEYARHYESCLTMLKLPILCDSIEPTRRFLWENEETSAGGKFFLLDDDLTFCKRIKDDYKHTRYCNKEDIDEIFCVLEEKLNEFGQVGVSERLGNNRFPEEFKINTKCIRCVGYNLKLIPTDKIKFGRMELMEDYDLTLQLLRNGVQNWVYYKYCQEQGGSNKKGGCSEFRTPELQRENALKLQSFHPDFVKTKIKKTKGGWFNSAGISERTDVVVQWKKASQSYKGESNG